MNPEKMSPGEIARYGRKSMRKLDDEEEEEKPDKLIYKSTNLTGRKRNRCSFTSAINYVFQSLCSDGAKMAMWRLYRAGMGPYIWNFIHE